MKNAQELHVWSVYIAGNVNRACIFSESDSPVWKPYRLQWREPTSSAQLLSSYNLQKSPQLVSIQADRTLIPEETRAMRRPQHMSTHHFSVLFTPN